MSSERGFARGTEGRTIGACMVVYFLSLLDTSKRFTLAVPDGICLREHVKGRLNDNIKALKLD